MTFRMIQKIQEYNHRIVHRQRLKHCNADGLSNKPNEKPSGKGSEGEDLRSQVPEFQTMKKALGSTQEDLNTVVPQKRKLRTYLRTLECTTHICREKY